MTTLSVSKTLRASASTLCLTAALMMGACGPKDKGGAPVISAEKAPLGLSELSDKDFAKHFAMPTRKTDEAEAQKALAALGLTESNANGLTWGAQEGSAGNYVYSNLKSTSDDGDITIGKAQIFGVHINGDAPAFDRADFGELVISSDEATIKIDAMSLARPTADTAKALITSLEKLGKDSKLDFGDDAKFGFGALSIKSLDMTAADVTGTVDQLVWGVDEATERADLKLGNVDFNLPQDGSDISSVLTLKSFSTRGFNVKGITEGLSAGLKGRGSSALMKSLLSGVNAYDKPYDTFEVEALEFDSSALRVNVPKVEADAVTKGDITTITQIMSPMNFEFKDVDKAGPNAAFDVFKQYGFENITMKSSQVTVMDKANDTVEVKDGIFDMLDLFRLNYTYKASGLEAASKAQKQNLIDGSDSPWSSQTQPLEILGLLKMHGMTLSLEDNSIVERGLKIAAEITKKDVNRLKQEMRAGLTLAPILARNDLEKDILSQFGGAFMDFVDDGGTLTVQLAPEAPLNLADIDALNNLSPDAFGFSARHDE